MLPTLVNHFISLNLPRNYSDFNCGPTQNALLYTVVPDLCLQKLTKISWNRQIDEFFLITNVQSGNPDRRIFRENVISIFPKLHWFDEIFREIAGNSAPELPEFDRKSQKFRQFGVFTKFLSLSKLANLVTLSSVKRSESYHDQGCFHFPTSVNFH